jgi:hypothetical protein
MFLLIVFVKHLEVLMIETVMKLNSFTSHVGITHHCLFLYLLFKSTSVPEILTHTLPYDSAEFFLYIKA